MIYVFQCHDIDNHRQTVDKELHICIARKGKQTLPQGARSL